MSGKITNVLRNLFGDHRDKKTALREAGFKDESEASQWADSLFSEPVQTMSEPALVKKIREARPDLTLSTATYIARQAKTRNP